MWTEPMCLLDLRTSWVLKSNREEAGNEEVIKASFFPREGQFLWLVCQLSLSLSELLLFLRIKVIS